MAFEAASDACSAAARADQRAIAFVVGDAWDRVVGWAGVGWWPVNAARAIMASTVRYFAVGLRVALWPSWVRGVCLFAFGILRLPLNDSESHACKAFVFCGAGFEARIGVRSTDLLISVGWSLWDVFAGLVEVAKVEAGCVVSSRAPELACVDGAVAVEAAVGYTP